MLGSEANDSYYYDGDQIKTRTNHNGGILGGITDGMPIIYKVAIKPPASITKVQQTINIEDKTAAELSVEGRHDPIIVPRAIPVLEAVTAIAIRICCWIQNSTNTTRMNGVEGEYDGFRRLS